MLYNEAISKMAENSCCDLQMERFQLINNLFSAKFCRTFEITSNKKGFFHEHLDQVCSS